MSDTQSISVINLQTTPLDPWKHVMKSCGSPEEWPASSPHLCWWCCHTFSTVPCFLPVRFEESQRKFTFTGNFCSWNCVKRYAFDLQMRRSTPPPGTSFIAPLAFITTIRCNDDDAHSLGLCDCNDNDIVRIAPSPDRETLQAFGGTMTIEEYRAGFLIIHHHDNVRFMFDEKGAKQQRKLRNCTFTRVAYEGPSKIFHSVVQILPYSSRSVTAPNVPKSKLSSKPPSTRNATTLRPHRASSSRQSSTTAPAPVRRAPPPSTVLDANDEQAFYTKRLNACGNLMQSMGVKIQR